MSISAGNTSSCSTCGRNFNPDSLARHAPICAKNTAKKPRKAFNVQKQRVSGTDVSYNELKRNEKKKPSIKEIRAAERKNNWREKHEDFVSSIREARGEPEVQTSKSATSYSNAQSYGHYQNGRNYEPARKPSLTGANQTQQDLDRIPTRRGPVPKAGYIKCPHCYRNFAEESGERHMPFCEEQMKKKAMKDKQNGSSLAAKKMAARTQYKPPKPKATGINSPSVTKVKSSGYGNKSNPSIFDDNERYDVELLQKPRLAPSAGRRAKENVLSYTNRASNSPKREKSGKLRRACHSCSTIYPVDWAKYCCECGKKRMQA